MLLKIGCSCWAIGQPRPFWRARRCDIDLCKPKLRSHAVAQHLEQITGLKPHWVVILESASQLNGGGQLHQSARDAVGQINDWRCGHQLNLSKRWLKVLVPLELILEQAFANERLVVFAQRLAAVRREKDGETINLLEHRLCKPKKGTVDLATLHEPAPLILRLNASLIGTA